ncbi:hypothetical protein B0F90DRAFT_1818848 [Multifurca ochricompacta]|uniref:Uncharacterized protein n=1 Tax=Multifurca ochricompacta TaxID=376703 RepID=A0AAD4QJL6_9AGAM|nr:hypothetical protein B0F90DRAFT_1818848 [Multifurca ochricompacta]
MKFFTTFFLAALAVTVSSQPLESRDVDQNLVPQFGATRGVNPDGTGYCDGAVKGSDNKPVKVLCTCPPDRATFIASLNANVNAGHIVNNPSISAPFPTDGSTASQLVRLRTSIATLENMNGQGKGCPVESTTFLAQEKALEG